MHNNIIAFVPKSVLSLESIVLYPWFWKNEIDTEINCNNIAIIS
jgi:hypothetical protein